MGKPNWDKAAMGPMGLAYPDRMTLLEKLECRFQNRIEPDKTAQEAHAKIIELQNTLSKYEPATPNQSKLIMTLRVYDDYPYGELTVNPDYIIQGYEADLAKAILVEIHKWRANP
jgi:hypothetical protein